MIGLLPMALAAELAWPALELSATALDFGLVPLGSAATHEITVTNTGELPMGLRVELPAHPSADFTYGWDTAACDDGTPLLPGDELQADTGESSYWDAREPEPGAEAVLPPGCSVTIELGYAPTEGGAALGALVLTTSGDYPHGRSDFQVEQPAYAEEAAEFQHVVRLDARNDAEAPGDSSPVVLVLDASPDVCREGEQISLRALVVDPDGQTPSLQWGSDQDNSSAGLGDLFAEATTFTCPEVEKRCESEELPVYLLATDPDGHQSWADTRIWVIDRARERTEGFLAGRDTCPSTPSDDDEREPGCDCGCSGSAASLPFGLVLGAAWLRRRMGSRG